MKTKHIVAIIVAIITTVGVVGAAWIKEENVNNNIDVTVQIDGKSFKLNNDDVQELALENEKLKEEISKYESEINTYKLESEKDQNNDEVLVDFQNLGLSINGEDKAIDKNKSSVLINGERYYAQDVLEKSLPDKMDITIDDDVIYIGKIVKNKKNLLDQQIIDKGFDVFIYDNLTDTYGNIYEKALCFLYNDCYVVFNAEKEYSKFKCTICMQEGYNGESIVKIEADDQVVYTSDKISCQTAPFEIDIPINMASKLSFKTIGKSGGSRILICNGVLYNEN